MHSYKVPHVKPRIALTFNEEVGGSTVFCVKKVMEDLNTDVFGVDYRQIVPKKENLENIFEDPSMMAQVIEHAKRQAKRFFDLQNVDCLILSGASTMIDPRLYGQPPRDDEKTDLARSLAELALVHVALQKGIPILGICGGHQILNVYFGGQLEKLSTCELKQQGYRQYGHVKIEPNSFMAKVFYNHKTPDNNYCESFFGAHEQAISLLGGEKRINNAENFFNVFAKAGDVRSHVEGIESQYGSIIIGVQYHSEVAITGVTVDGTLQFKAINLDEIEKNLKIFEIFKQAAESYRAKRNLQDFFTGDTSFYAKPTSRGAGENNGVGSTKRKAVSEIFNNTLTTEDSEPEEERYLTNNSFPH